MSDSRPTPAGDLGRRSARRITSDEFTFLRAVLQCMSLRDATDRLLSSGLDLRLVQANLKRLRTELLVAARRAHAYCDARALQLDLAQLPTDQAQAAGRKGPTLEAFRDQVDPGGDFYSEAELIELYREQYPPSALLEERIARRLEAVGLVTLEKFAAWIDQKGSSWYRPIRRSAPWRPARSWPGSNAMHRRPV